MAARSHGQRQRGDDKPPHDWSLTRKLLGWALVTGVATSCETPPTRHTGFDARPCTPDLACTMKTVMDFPIRVTCAPPWSATRSEPALADDFTLTAWRTIARDRTGRLNCQLQYDKTGDQRVEVPMADDTTTGFYVLAATGGAVTVSSVAVYTQPLQPCPASAACDDVRPVAGWN